MFQSYSLASESACLVTQEICRPNEDIHGWHRATDGNQDCQLYTQSHCTPAAARHTASHTHVCLPWNEASAAAELLESNMPVDGSWLPKHGGVAF